MSRIGVVNPHDADTKTGNYFVSVESRGKVALALGPFVQRKPGPEAHRLALGYVGRVRRYVMDHDGSRDEPWYAYGTLRIPLGESAPAGKLNAALMPDA